MKRTILAIIFAGLPFAAAAQDGPAQPVSPSDTEAALPAPSPDAASQNRFAPRNRSRPSMVSYIEDATLGSAFRIRYDTAWDMNAPDRAEFFYAKCGCYRTGVPELDPSAPGPGPGVVTTLNSRQLSILTQRGTGRVSVFMELPFRWIDPTAFVPGTGSFGNESGVGDILVGTKVAIASSTSHIITIMMRGSIPTGDSSKGLGTDHGSFEPALLVRQTLGGRAQIEGMFGDRHPTGSATGPGGSGNFAGDVLYYGIGPSFDLVNNRSVRFAPVVELLGWHVLGGFQTDTTVPSPTVGVTDASGANILQLKAGARVAMTNGGSLYVGYGFSLTNQIWDDHALRLEYRRKF